MNIQPRSLVARALRFRAGLGASWPRRLAWLNPRGGYWHLARFLAAASVLVSVSGGLVALIVSPAKYSATMIVGPIVSDPRSISDGSSKLSGSSLGGLGGLAGILSSTGGGMPQRFLKFLTLVRSQAVSQDLGVDPHIMHTVFAAHWNERQQRWHPPRSPASTAKRVMRMIFGQPGWTTPDSYDLARYLSSQIKVTLVRDTPYRVITFRHQDKEFAVYFLNHLFRAADNHMKADEIESTTAYLSFLDKQLATSPSVELRQSLIVLMARYQNEYVLASLPTPLAVDVLQPPMVSRVPVEPDVLFVLLMSITVGTGLAILVLYGFHFYRQAHDHDDAA